MAFDDSNVRWFPLGALENFVVAMCDVDEKRKVVDFLAKFDAGKQIILHRHLSLTNTLVMQGEHRIYEPDGRLKEIRKVGSYTSSVPGPAHREGGGAEDCVIFYSIRGGDEPAMFELLNDDGSVAQTLTIEDFLAVYREQKAALAG